MGNGGKMKSKRVWGLIAGAVIISALFTNTTQTDDACSKDALCERIVAGIKAARREGTGLTDAQVLEHIGSRLGFGMNPIEIAYREDLADPVRVRNLAYHVAHQIKHSRRDGAQLLSGIGAVAPLAFKSMSQLGLEREAARAKYSAAQAKLDADVAAGKLKARDEAFCEATPDEYCRRLSAVRSLQTVVLAYSTTNATAQHRRADLLRMALGSQQLDSHSRTRDLQVNLEAVLLEFWMNHFNIDYMKSGTLAMGSDGYSALIRARMRGDFRGLLTNVTMSPGMLHYLDNQANSYNTAQMAAANQNLGRELLELHTLGIGPRAAGTGHSPYTQVDVENTAAILTGSTYVSRVEKVGGVDTYVVKGVFNKAAHIPAEVKVGSKMVPVAAPRVMGKVYSHALTKGSGADITTLPATHNGQLVALLADLAAHSRTRLSICNKLTRLFVSGPDVIDVRNACIVAYGTHGDLKSLYSAILTHKSFWDIKNYRKKLRNPVELAISAARRQGINIKDLALAPAVSSTGAARAFSVHLANHLDGMVSNLGLSLRGYAFPTGYNINGSVWISKGFLTQSVVYGFRFSNFYESYSKQVSSRLATQANESVYRGLSARKDRDAFLFSKVHRRPSSLGMTNAESATIWVMSRDPKKQDSYKVGSQAKLSELRTAMELSQSSRFALRK